MGLGEDARLEAMMDASLYNPDNEDGQDIEYKEIRGGNAMKEIRTLRADEIEVRIGGFNKAKTGGFLLLYKDARVDMRILDEIYGPMNWQRSHEVINGNLFCNISVWDDAKGSWITKQDVGVESANDATKGQASDAFKRAAFNWGIGRELYTAPFIWIQGLGKYDKFKVTRIGYNQSREIIHLEITEEKTNRVVYKLENGKQIFINSNTSSKQPPVSTGPSKAYNNTQATGKGQGGSNNNAECQSCGASVSQGVQEFSKKQYNKVLCMECQKKESGK